MADENLYSLLIRVEGGDLAAAEIIKSKYALAAVGRESTDLKDRFQERFQHIALRGFLADAGQAIGLGSELRPVIGVLNMSLMQLEATMGAGAAAFAPYIAGLAAIVGLGVVVYEHFSKHVEALGETLKGYKENIKAIDEYVHAGGTLSQNLRQLRDDYQKLAVETLSALRAQNELKLAQDQVALSSSMQRDSVKQTGLAFGDLGGDMVAASEETRKHRQAVDQDTAAIEANNHGFATAAEMVKSNTENLQHNTEAHKEKIKAQEEDAVWQSKAIEQAYEAGQAHKLLRIEAANAIDDIKQRRAKESLDYQIELDRMQQKHKSTMEKMAADAAHAAGQIQQVFNNAFARVILDHGKAADVMKAAQSQLEQHFISSAMKIAEDFIVQEGKKLLMSLKTAAEQKAADAAAQAALVAKTAATDALGLSAVATTKALVAMDFAAAGAP